MARQRIWMPGLILSVVALTACARPAENDASATRTVIVTPSVSTTPTETYTEADRIEIYAVVLRDQYLPTDEINYPSYWKLYIVRELDDRIVDDDAPQREDPLILTESTQKGISEALADLEIVWIGPDDPIIDAVTDPENSKHIGEIVIFGDIHFKVEGLVEVGMGYYCGSVCGMGLTYTIWRDMDGHWHILGEPRTNWVS